MSITKSYYPPVVNEKEKDMYYKGYYIFRNIRGMYTSFLKYKGYYAQSDTLKELKSIIREDKEQADFFSCK